MADKQRLTTTTDHSAGTVEHTGGRAIWRWAREKLDSTSILLKKLENSAIRLREDGAKDENPEDAPVELSLTGEPMDEGGGFDPYDSKP